MSTQNPVTSSKANPLRGVANIPGDKSMSHRALMMGGLAVGETIISGLLEGEDVMHTADAMRSLGATIEGGSDGLWRTFGVGVGGLKEPDTTLQMGNSGTSTRLLIGLVSTHPITCTFEGDESLTKRPMNRVIKPLEIMGAEFMAREGGRLPLTVKGTGEPMPIEYESPVASAQVKSAIMLAGLATPGTTTVIENTPTRDHTEHMLRHFGVSVEVEDLKNGAQAIHVQGQQELEGCAIDIFSDPSSAAFPAVAALINEGSEIRLPNIGLNPRRAGLFQTLIEMGADIKYEDDRIQTGERVADLIIKADKPLKGIHVPPARVPSMIDEFPILAVAASCAIGKTTMMGLEELRVKESDRLLMMANGLKACGVDLEMGEDSLTINGTGKPPKGGATIETALDHRIAMSFLILGSVTDEPITIDDGSPIKTSFPDFVDLMNGLGLSIIQTD
ncbi:MAG: 3-phosphoshikimate 1-carboxyvinyltransferase [Pseudomonadota bacterium]